MDIRKMSESTPLLSRWFFSTSKDEKKQQETAHHFETHPIIDDENSDNEEEFIDIFTTEVQTKPTKSEEKENPLPPVAISLPEPAPSTILPISLPQKTAISPTATPKINLSLPPSSLVQPAPSKTIAPLSPVKLMDVEIETTVPIKEDNNCLKSMSLHMRACFAGLFKNKKHLQPTTKEKELLTISL